MAARGSHVIDLVYDPLGRLFQGLNTQFVYDGDDLVAEYTGGSVRHYAHGAGSDDALIWYDGASVTAATRRQLFADPRGSIVAIADGGGALMTRDSYDEWGIPAAANAGRFQYTGQIWIAHLGLYHYKARAYSPTLGRFMQTDPVGYDGGINIYAYVGNDPVNAADPSGEQIEPCPLTNCDPPPSGLLQTGVRGARDLVVNTVNGVLNDLNTFAESVTQPGSHSIVETLEAAAGIVSIVAVPEAAPEAEAGRAMAAGSRVVERLPRERISAPPPARGRPPIGDDGYPVELHHVGQNSGGPLREMTRTDHRGSANYSRNHANTGQQPSRINRSEMARQRRDHWEREHDSGRFK